MLRKFSNYRTHSDNLKLGAITAFSAGMVNVISVILFFSFTSNVTGHFAILAQSISEGNWYQAAVVFLWISAFFGGNFTSNLFVINGVSKKSQLLTHSIPLALEIGCLLTVGVYTQYFFSDSLQETEVLVGIMLFAMGLQNGLTASISNSAVKTTHLTGLTTDLGILMAMFTKKEYRRSKDLVNKAHLLFTIMLSYVSGGVLSGVIYYSFGYAAFYLVCSILALIIIYDLYRLFNLGLSKRNTIYLRETIIDKQQTSKL